MKKALKTLGKILASLAALIVIVVLVFNVYQHSAYKEYFAAQEKAFLIPDIDKGFVPQGLSFDETTGYFLTCGYMKDGSPSRLYYIDPKTSEYGFLQIMEHADGQYVYTTTVPTGVSVYGDYIFMCTGDVISVYNENVIDTLATDLVPIATFDPETHPAFCHVDGTYLYVGECYVAETNETDRSHHIYTDAGDFNQAIITAFDLTELTTAIKENNLETIAPSFAYSITDNAQGMCFDANGSICISTSNGIKASHVKVYANPKVVSLKEDEQFKTKAGEEIPLYYLDKAHLIKDVPVQPMAKELYFYGEKFSIISESASNKYFFGKLTGNKYCYSFEIEY